jgi:Copper type II ascorbate-dependent monooxygenase, C-terminal domain
MRHLFVCLFVLCSMHCGAQISTVQTPTYVANIRPLVNLNCAGPCHHPGGVGPFSLLSYQDVAKRGKFIAKVTQIRYMPPFPADRTFRHYANERGLSDTDIALIQTWVKGGMREGEPTQDNTQQSISSTVTDGKGAVTTSVMASMPDLVLTMKPYAIPGNGSEDFRYFHIPMNLLQDVWVQRIEFVPGNRQRLHHSRLMVDSTGTMAAIDGISETDPRLRDFQRTPLADEFLYGWVPGNDVITFPAGTAKRIRAGSDLLLNVHYAPTPRPETDQSTVRLYFAKQPVQKAVQTLTLTENNVSNQPFELPANTRPTFYMRYGPLPDSLHLLSVMPHMHRLGKTIKAFAITPDGDVINLVKIDNWDYNWQMTYQFEQPLTLPKGAVILAEATYDNTDQNPENPNHPARTVTYGWNSTDEMLNIVFYYVK